MEHGNPDATLFIPYGEQPRWIEDFADAPTGARITGHIVLLNQTHTEVLEKWEGVLCVEPDGLLFRPMVAT